MSRESRLIKSDILDPQTTITQYECFGWELLSVNGDLISMSRETQNPVYSQLVMYQAQYEKLYAQYRALPPLPSIQCGTVVLLTILFVAPAVLYVVFSKVKKQHILSERNRLLAEMAEICAQSRAVFFSRQA